MVSETPAEAFDRGAEVGAIRWRLADHDVHFAAINGSLAAVAAELHLLNMAVQRLHDQAVSNAATVVTTAAALRDAEEAKVRQGEQSWSPWAKAIALAAGAVTVISIATSVVLGVLALRS
jgi:uncharacterized membrane protein YhaH (DUF805 family)